MNQAIEEIETTVRERGGRVEIDARDFERWAKEAGLIGENEVVAEAQLIRLTTEGEEDTGGFVGLEFRVGNLWVDLGISEAVSRSDPPVLVVGRPLLRSYGPDEAGSEIATQLEEIEHRVREISTSKHFGVLLQRLPGWMREPTGSDPVGQ